MRLKSALIPLAVGTGIFISCGVAVSGENCTCRGNGRDIPEGETVCLKTASGMKLARCERVLNNTSWKILQSGCPTANVLPQAPRRTKAG